MIIDIALDPDQFFNIDLVVCSEIKKRRYGNGRYFYSYLIFLSVVVIYLIVGHGEASSVI